MKRGTKPPASDLLHCSVNIESTDLEVLQAAALVDGTTVAEQIRKAFHQYTTTRASEIPVRKKMKQQRQHREDLEKALESGQLVVIKTLRGSD